MAWFNLKSSEQFLTLFMQIKYDIVKQYVKIYKELDVMLKTTEVEKLAAKGNELSSLKPDYNSQNRRNRYAKEDKIN